MKIYSLTQNKILNVNISYYTLLLVIRSYTERLYYEINSARHKKNCEKMPYIPNRWDIRDIKLNKEYKS